MISKRALFLFIFALTLTAAPAAESSILKKNFTQIQSLNFDFDDNIFTTPTQVMLIDQETGKEVGVSTQNWALIKLQVEGQGFKEGNNFLRFFGDTSDQGADLFPNQIKQALKGTPSSWKGPVWDEFVNGVANAKVRPYISIITARLHSRHSIYRGLQVLAEASYANGQKLLDGLPDEERVYPVGWPGLEPEFKDPSSADSKAKVMSFLLDQVEKVEVPADAAWIDDRNGGGKKAQLHTWAFMDDDYNNISVAFEKLSPLVKSGRWSHVKILLFHTGTNNPVRKAHSIVIQSDGTARPTTVNER